jgi:hypothetical protein
MSRNDLAEVISSSREACDAAISRRAAVTLLAARLLRYARNDSRSG